MSRVLHYLGSAAITTAISVKINTVEDDAEGILLKGAIFEFSQIVHHYRH